MPKKSIVQNGWTGGINQDYEVTDITSESRDGRNELNTLENGLCNINGKVRCVGLASSAQSIATISTDGASKSLAVYGAAIYRQKGVYKVGENIEWSGNTIVTKPTQDILGSTTARRHIMADGIALNAYANIQNDTNIFLGKMASNNGGDAKLADKGYFPATATSPSDDFVRFATDGDDDERFEQDHFNDYNRMGIFHANSDWTAAFWDENNSGTTAVTSDAADGDGNLWGWRANQSGAEPTAGRMIDAGGYAAGTAITDAASTGIANADYLRIGRNSSSGTTYDNNDIGVMFRVGAMETSSDTVEPNGLYGTALDMSGKDIVIELQLNTSTGNTVGDDEAGSFWTGFTYLNITADSYKDNATIDYADSNFSPNSKTWRISKAELESAGVGVSGGTTAANGGTIITIAHSSAINTGANYLDTSVRNFVVTLEGGDMEGNTISDNDTVWAARIFSISLAESTKLGWSGSTSIFAQSRVNEADNGDQVESLLQYYPNTLESGALSTISMELYEPTDASYNGKIYYQPADDNGLGIGSIFKIADVSKSKGVKSVLSEFWQPWSSTTIAGCTINGVGTIGSISSTAELKVGMKVEGYGVDSNSYITDIPTETTVTVSDTSTSSGSGKTYTFSGVVNLDIAAPPLSTTYGFESGYPDGTKTVNALWEHGTTVGRQAYIANVIKTGRDLAVELHNADSTALPTDTYPVIDTTLYSGTDSIELRVKMLSGTAYSYSVLAPGVTPSYSSSMNIIAADAYQNLDSGGQAPGKYIKVKFPQATGYTADDEWKITISKESDLILKTPIGKRWGFSDLNFIDLELPGTGITALFSSAERLFVFSANDLTIVNVAQDYEYLEATLPGYGVSDPKMVVRVGEGIAFVNSSGVFYFDGREVISLSDDKMESFSWSNVDAIGYLPDEKLIFVWYATDDIISYSLVQKAWVGITKAVSNPPATQTLLYNNRPVWINGSDDYQMYIDNLTTDAFSMVTGAISCGDLSRTKKFIKALVNIDTGSQFELYYRVDGGSWSSAIDLSDGESAVNIKESGKTIQFKIESDQAIDDNSAISDLSLIYREKTIR
tara:strand:- start:945 stop:4151 length:3207 start_codon:yes stop_codon:yes gene_type:complete